MDGKDIVFVDVETTGGKVSRDRIIDIGIVKVSNGHVVETFESLINPQGRLPSYITTITGIKEEDLQQAPRFKDIHDQVFSLLKGCLFVAHNVRFDYGFIKNAFNNEGRIFSAQTACTVKLSRYFFPGYAHHNLDSLIARFGLSCPRRHRAYDDAWALWEFYQCLLQRFSPLEIQDALGKVMKVSSIPTHLGKECIQQIPESAGVYIFKDRNNTPLYVGKSKNVKERVLSHFSGTHSISKELTMFQQISDIEVHKTSGEFGALLLESKLVKELNPVYNRKLRKYEEMWIIQQDVDEGGYNKAVVRKVDTIEEINNVMGVFRTKQKAKRFLEDICQEYHLCKILLGLEQAEGACFGYQLKRCQGACIHQEDSYQYNMRFIAAFSATRIQPWPFTTPILVEEKNDREHEGYVFHQWIYYGSMKSYDDTMTTHMNVNPVFDIDVYDILQAYLKKLPLKPLSFEQFNSFIQPSW